MPVTSLSALAEHCITSHWDHANKTRSKLSLRNCPFRRTEQYTHAVPGMSSISLTIESLMILLSCGARYCFEGMIYSTVSVLYATRLGV